MSQLITKSVGWLKPDETQARQHFDQRELKQLGDSLKDRQLQPILARPDGSIIAGNRRYFAAKLVGLESLEVRIIEGELSKADIRGMQLTENIHRADLRPYEKWQACRELLELNGWQGKELAAHLHLDPSTVTRLLSPDKCIFEAQEALREGKISISDCYAMSKVDEDKQKGLLALKLSGASRDDLERAGRKARNGTKKTVRASSIKVSLSGGSAVTIKGEAMDLALGIEALKEALKQMNKAHDSGLDVKTAQNVWRDMAKAG